MLKSYFSAILHLSHIQKCCKGLFQLSKFGNLHLIQGFYTSVI